MENINVDNLLKNILSRANSIIDCLPSFLQDNIREVINFVDKFCFEQKFKYENINDNIIYHGRLSEENLYMCLSCLSRDLGICNLLFPGNVYLEDAAHNMGIIMNYIVNFDRGLNYIYNVNKRRIK